MKGRFGGILPALALALLVLQPASLWACSACYGQSDSPLAAGMNWGILSLLGVLGVVLGGISGFFVFLARKSATASPLAPVGPAMAAEGPRLWSAARSDLRRSSLVSPWLAARAEESPGEKPPLRS